MDREKALEASPLVGLHETRCGALAAKTPRSPQQQLFLLEKGVMETNFCARCAKLGKLECACIATDKAASLLVGALGPSMLAICLAFNCTDGPFNAIDQAVRVHFKGAHSTCAWQMIKSVDAFDKTLGLPQTRKKSPCDLSLGVVTRPSRLYHSLRLQ
jgi:hypothetical protein